MPREILFYQLEHRSYCIVWAPRPRYRGRKIISDELIKQKLKRMFKQIGNWKDSMIICVWRVGEKHIHLHTSGSTSPVKTKKIELMWPVN